MNRLEKSAGFTLLEMTIVLVVVALTAAGILFGRDLVFAAKLRAQISQIEEMNSAVNSFESKYACLPGDCKNAVRFKLGGDMSPGDDGDGDDILDANIILTVIYDISTPELANFWYHLMMANLIKGEYPGYTDGDLLIPGVDTPALKLEGHGRIEPWYPQFNTHTRGSGGLCIVYPPQLLTSTGTPFFGINQGHALVLASRCDGYPNVVYRANEIYAIDSKIDDGQPYQGNMRGYMYGLLMWDNPLIEAAYNPYLCIKNDVYNIAGATLEPSDPGYLLGLQCGAVIQTSF